MLGMVAMAPGARNISVPLLSDRADLTVDINFDLLKPSARPDSDIIRLKASQRLTRRH